MTNKQNIVLVVDDDLAVGESLKFALEIEGLVVRICISGPALLEHPELRAAACILLDYRMPVMDGFAVLVHLVTQGLTIPVILMTAHATVKLRHRAALAGVRHVLEKPLFNGGLLNAIREILGGHPVPTAPLF